MILGALSACFDNPQTDDTSGSESSSESSSNSESSSESSKTESDTDGGDESEESTTAPDDEYVEETHPALLEGDNAEFIEYADRIANGVNAYFTNPDRTGYYLDNQNVSVTYDLQNTKLVTAVSNKAGANYVENTMDVFLRMKDGTTYFASEGSADPEVNIYKLGYYFYENRIEGLSFDKGYVFEDTKGLRIPHTRQYILRENLIEFVENESGGGVKYKATSNIDPWLSYKNINFSASDYNVLAVTMKADGQFTNGLECWVIAGGNKEFTTDHRTSITMIPDGEYHTYYIPLYKIKDYMGTVTGLRLDLLPSSGALDATFAIKELRLLKADLSNTHTSAGVYLNRIFNAYSDKLHQTLQVSTVKDIDDVQAIGMITNIPAERVGGIVIKDRNGLHYDLEKIAWNTVQYVGFDIKGAGIYGYILPYDGSGGSIKVTLSDGVYVIEQQKAPDGLKLLKSEKGTNNANDFFMGHRIYTDRYHTFDKFIVEAELEINPLTAENFIVDKEASPVGEFVRYDALRGCYTLIIEGDTGFTRPLFYYQNKQFNLTLNIKGDGANDRKVYVLARWDGGGALEGAAILDENQMLIPIPLEVGKNYTDGNQTIFDLDDSLFSETILPMVVNKDTDTSYTILNLYHKWGKYLLQQISYITYYTPYYHLSTGIHESNCITPYYFVNQPKDIMQMLPDHRPMSGPLQTATQHVYAGVHSFLEYTDADGNFVASECIKSTIGSFGPIYADVTMDFISDDGKMKISYNHMEMPQTDENRTYYEMKYEVLEDISFADFGRDFSFYTVRSYDPSGQYTKVGYLDTNNESQWTLAAKRGETKEFVLGDNCPYFSFFDMPDSTHRDGYNNLSFMIYNAEFVIGGEKANPSFLVVNEYANLSLSLDLDEVVLKKGDTFTINAILMAWQPYNPYDEVAPDINVRTVRQNSLLDPLKATADKDCTIMESVFLPKVKTTNGKSAEFTLSGGHNNVAVRIYGFEKLTAPVIEEYVDGEWKLVDISSFSTPDNFGYGYYYDGYGVYYDGDGTFSYAFVTTMDNGAPRKFRVTAAEDFEGWPEIIKEPDPMNHWINYQEINATITASANRFGEYTIASEDGIRYVRINRAGDTKEATVTFFDNEEGALAGRYLAYMVRLPQGSDAKIAKWEFYTGTEHTMYDADGNILIVGEEYNAVYTDLADGEWHVIVLDLAAFGKTDSFKASDDGEYYVKYLRWDVFNPGGNPDAIIDIAYIGMHNSIDDILDYHKDDKINIVCFNSASSYDTLKTAKVEEPDPLNYWLSPLDLDGFFAISSSRFGETQKLVENDMEFFRVNRGGKTNEATITFFDDANGILSGRYLVYKFRLPQGADAQFNKWEFYIATEHTMYDADGNILIGAENYVADCLDLADGEWHVVVVDLEAYGKADSFKAADDGSYYAKYLRFDVFNAGGNPETILDLAYIGMHNSLDEIFAYNSDMSEIAICSGTKGYTLVDPSTGEAVAAE